MELQDITAAKGGENVEPLLQGDGSHKKPAPKDRFMGVFIILFLQGCTILAPWNMFITICYPYFVGYKLNANYVNETGEWVGKEKADELKDWQNQFCYRMTVANQVPNMLFTILNCFIQFGEHTLGMRIVASILITLATFIATIILAAIDTSESLHVFVYVTLAIVVIMMAVNGVYQNSVWGLIAPLPMNYANAIITGNNFVGILIVIFSIVIKISAPNIKIAAIIFFVMGVVLLVTALATYFVLPRLNFYKFHTTLRQKNQDKAQNPTFLDALKTFARIFKKLYIHYWDVFAIFFVSLFIFPNITMWIAPMEGETFFTSDIFKPFYMDILCFLSLNVFAFLGSLIPNWLPQPDPKHLWIFTTLRFLFIPLFMLMNYQPVGRVRRFGVLIGSSWAYLAAMILFASSHGHGASLAMMYVPKQAGKDAGKAAMLAGVFLVLGVNAGLIASEVVGAILLRPSSEESTSAVNVFNSTQNTNAT